MDTQLFYLLNNLAAQSIYTDRLIVFLAEYLPFVLVAFFLVFLLYSRYSNHEKIISALSAGIAGILARYGITTPIRFIWNRPRPFVVLHVHQLIPESSYSFPSGHASFFFAFSTIVYLYNKKLGILFLIATVFMTLARVAAGVHYPSDILAGAIVGIFSGWLTFKFLTPLLRKIPYLA